MKRIYFIGLSLASAGFITAGAIGIASAASINTNSNIGTSNIPRSVFREERLDAVEQVLDTTTANIKSAHKDKTFSTLVTGAGLTKKTYKEKLRVQLTSDLEAKGYTQDQITIALQRSTIEHFRNHHK